MYTKHTYQDWLDTPEAERPELARQIVQGYKASAEFAAGLTAAEYFAGDNTAIRGKRVLKATTITKKDDRGRTQKVPAAQEIVGNQIRSNFFFRAVVQQCQYLLGNGVTLETPEQKMRLGLSFDKAVEQLGESALLNGVAWGYWNLDHIEPISAVKDALSGFVALLDEMTGFPMVGLQFWQLSADKPQYLRIFEPDGVGTWRYVDGKLMPYEEKRAYKLRVTRDSVGVTEMVGENYGVLPVIPFYGNTLRVSELTPAIKSKIDLYDVILSDFGDNLERANDIYWVLNNFGGTTSEIADMLEEIHRLKVVCNFSDGTGGGSTATAQTMEVPHEARRVALELLRKELYSDFMALDMDELTGGSLTNVAIEAARTNLDLKADRFEWQAFAFVQAVLRLIGIETEVIRFKRQALVNRSETVQDIVAMREDIDRETALQLNPYIDEEQIPQIMQTVAVEEVARMASIDTLNRVANS